MGAPDSIVTRVYSFAGHSRAERIAIADAVDGNIEAIVATAGAPSHPRNCRRSNEIRAGCAGPLSAPPENRRMRPDMIQRAPIAM